jgi:hypothetical protein
MLLVTRPGYDPTEMVKGGDFVVAGMSFYTPIIEHVPHGGLEVCCGRNRERPELVGSSEDADRIRVRFTHEVATDDIFSIESV